MWLLVSPGETQLNYYNLKCPFWDLQLRHLIAEDNPWKQPIR